MCFNLNTHGLERLHSWQKVILSSIFLILWLFLKSSNNSSLLLNMKDNLSESCSQNPIYCMGCDFTCYSIAAIKWQGIDLGINQVSTLLCNQTCKLEIKFMQHCCKWTKSWLVHVTSSQMNLVAYALSMQSSYDLVLALLCTWTVNNMLWFNNNSCLGSCSCDYQFIYCCYGIAIANEASAFNLTFMWAQFEFVSLWRRMVILFTLLITCTWMRP